MYNWKVTKPEMKKINIKKLLVFFKYTAGSIGVGTIIADHKWIGIACLVVGAASDAALKSFFNNESE